MKSQILAVVLVLTLVAWLPAVAQQHPGSQPAPSADSKAATGACCHHQAHHGDDAKAAGLPRLAATANPARPTASAAAKTQTASSWLAAGNTQKAIHAP
jgi:hypothetical protein